MNEGKVWSLEPSRRARGPFRPKRAYTSIYLRPLYLTCYMLHVYIIYISHNSGDTVKKEVPPPAQTTAEPPAGPGGARAAPPRVVYTYLFCALWNRTTHCARLSRQWVVHRSVRRDGLSSLEHGLCLAATRGRGIGERGFPHRSSAQRRRPLEVRGRLPELRRRARPHTTATWHLPGCGTRPRHRRARLSSPEQSAAPQPDRSAWPPS